MLHMGRVGVAGMATCYGPDDPGFEYRWGFTFCTPVQYGHGAHPPSYTIGYRVIHGGKADGVWR
jgi:hypothetical protein